VVRCLIVDDSAGFVSSARRLLERQGITVAGMATSGAEAVRRVAELRPDVVLVDIDLGGESGLDVADRLHRAGSPRIILISTHAEQDYRDLIAASPAVGFLSKTALSGRGIRKLLSSDGDGDGDASSS
jgi:two-component system, NarL family, nitrate/nitrite response regulator NarL